MVILFEHYTTLLDGSATGYTEWKNVSNFSQMIITVNASQDCTIHVQQSFDGNTVDYSSTIDVSAGVQSKSLVSVIATNARISIVNGGAAQTTFGLYFSGSPNMIGTDSVSDSVTLTGDAVVANVLAAKTFYKDDATTKLTGVMPNNAGDVNAVSSHRSGTSIHVVPATGYTDGSDDASVITDADFVVGNIRDTKEIFGLTGTYDHSIVPIVAADVIADEEGFVNGAKVTGTMVDRVGTAVVITPSAIDQAIPAGRYGGVVGDGKVAGDADLVASKIKDTVDIFGVVGTYDHEATNPVVAARMKTGDVAFVNGAKITGNGTVALDPDLDVYPAGYHAGNTSLHAVEADLVTGNIRATKTIFGVAGKTEVVDTTEGANAPVAANMQTGKKAWADGVEITGTVDPGSNVNGTEGALQVTIPDGIYAGSKHTTAADADLVAGNIKTSVNIFGVVGTFTGDAATKATGTIHSNGTDVSPDDTVLIDAKTYTFKETLTPAEGEILIGGTAAASLQNLKDAINHTGTPGTQYSCAAVHPTVEAYPTNDATHVYLRAKTAGIAGNSVSLSIDSDATLDVGTAFTGGTEPLSLATQLPVGVFAWAGGVKYTGTVA